MEKNKNLIAISGKSSSGKDTIAQMIQYFSLKQTLASRNMELFGTVDHYQIFSRWSAEEKASYSGREIHRFADTLKQIVSLLTGIPRIDLEKEEVKNSLLGEEWNYITQSLNEKLEPIDIHNKMTVRELLQKCGTDALRNNVHKDVHVNALFANYKGKVSGRTLIMDFSKMASNEATLPEYVTDSVYGEFPKWIIPDLRFYNEFLACKQRGAITIRVERDYDKSNPKYLHPSETELDGMRDEFDYTITNNGTISELLESVRYILKKEQII